MGLCLRRVVLQYPRLGWQGSTGINGSFQSESVAAFDWNRWQGSTGIRTSRRTAGRTITRRERDGGVWRTQCGAVRAHGATGGAPCSPSPPRVWPGPEGWLRGARPMPGEVKWYCRNLPADTPLQRLVELAHSRWPIEQFYEDAQGECGLAHDQGRRWDGLHRHLALVMLAYSFLARQRWTPAPLAGFSPLGGAAVFPSRPPPGARVALPRCGVMAHRHQSNRPVPPQANLTR
jgi:DDE family transposase